MTKEKVYTKDELIEAIKNQPGAKPVPDYYDEKGARQITIHADIIGVTSGNITELKTSNKVGDFLTDLKERGLLKSPIKIGKGDKAIDYDIDLSTF